MDHFSDTLDRGPCGGVPEELGHDLGQASCRHLSAFCCLTLKLKFVSLPAPKATKLSTRAVSTGTNNRGFWRSRRRRASSCFGPRPQSGPARLTRLTALLHCCVSDILVHELKSSPSSFGLNCQQCCRVHTEPLLAPAVSPVVVTRVTLMVLPLMH